jgi:hypothetical protein
VSTTGFSGGYVPPGRSPRPRGQRRGSAAARLLGLRVRIPRGTSASVSCDCCVLSVTGLCVGLITRPEVSYRLWCVSECDREASIMRRPWPTGGCCANKKIHAWHEKTFSLNLNVQYFFLSFLALPSSTYLFTAGVEGFCNFHLITLRRTQQSVGLLWMRDRPDAETST